MDPNQAPAPAQDTPPEPAPTGTPGDQQINYQQRYDDLRPQFDRTAQEAAQLRAEMQRVSSDPDYQRELMAQWGYDVEDPTGQDEDPSEELRQQLSELQEWRNTQTEAEQLRMIESNVAEQYKGLGVDLDDSTQEWITTRALNMKPREDGMPDIAGAHKAFTEWEQARVKAWAQTKQRAPRHAPGGAEGTQVPDLDAMGPSELAEWMAQEAMARMNS